MRFILKNNRGNLTTEYAVLLPAILAVITLAVVVFLIFYQGALLQNAAENLAEALARQWNYASFTNQEIKSGVYQKVTFDERELYWDLKGSHSKERAAQEYCREYVRNLGFLRFCKYDDSQADPEVTVSYTGGMRPEIMVSIEAFYVFPGSGILKALGLGEILRIEASARCNVHNAKDMINTTDYIFQMLRETGLFDSLDRKFQDIRNSVEKVLE